jgi:hypothetical protein
MFQDFTDFLHLVFSEIGNSDAITEYHFIHVLHFILEYNRLLTESNFCIDYVSEMIDETLISWLFQKVSIDSGSEGYILFKRWDSLKCAIGILKELVFLSFTEI